MSRRLQGWRRISQFFDAVLTNLGELLSFDRFCVSAGETPSITSNFLLSTVVDSYLTRTHNIDHIDFTRSFLSRTLHLETALFRISFYGLQPQSSWSIAYKKESGCSVLTLLFPFFNIPTDTTYANFIITIIENVSY